MLDPVTILLAIGILFFIVELFIPTIFVFVPLGIGCLVAALLTWLKVPWGIQIIVCGSITFISAWLAKRWFAKRTKHEEKEFSPKQLIGKTGVVKKIIDDKAIVYVEGEEWSAQSDMPLKEGDKVWIETLEGVHLKVVRLEDESS